MVRRCTLLFRTTSAFPQCCQRSGNRTGPRASKGVCTAEGKTTKGSKEKRGLKKQVRMVRKKGSVIWFEATRLKEGAEDKEEWKEKEDERQ